MNGSSDNKQKHYGKKEPPKQNQGQYQGSNAKKETRVEHSKPRNQQVNAKASHHEGKVQLNNQPPQRNLSVSPEVDKFWQAINKRVANTSKETNSSPIANVSAANERKLWLDCWVAAASGGRPSNESASDCCLSLARTYLMLPAVGPANPPERQVIILLLAVVRASALHAGKSAKVSRNLPFSVVVDVVKDRLLLFAGHSIVNYDLTANEELVQDIELLSKEYKLKLLQLAATEADNVDSLWSLLKLFSDSIKQYLCALQEHFVLLGNQKLSSVPSYEGEDDETVQVPPWLGWTTRPTVGWLMSPDWHIGVPELRSVYESAEEYAESLLRIWTLLTFYWGAGAVWPKCTYIHQGNKDACGQPLLFHGPSHNRKNTPCCNRLRQNGQTVNCGLPAEWMCHHFHHNAMCMECLQRRQNMCVDAPSVSASTDVYDAVVYKETTRSQGGVLLLSQVQSRKPPMTPPNWRTTYRIQCSALVGVVKLSVQNERLTREHPVQWAEMVQYDAVDQRAESGHRMNGRCALRLLTKGDCSALRTETNDIIEAGARIAIIDLRVFVPEVISVLSTFANSSFASHLSNIGFINQLIGIRSNTYVAHSMYTGSINDCINKAIRTSEISCIQRLPAEFKDDLIRRICVLRPVQSLYGTQLDAFASALQYSTHCTQGPPGTGKSYVGVCLVLALIEVRRVFKASGFGTLGPVLMLSYKNHALDEFLLDVLEFSALKSRELIRAGTTETEALIKFTEKFLKNEEEKRAQGQLNGLIDRQKAARTVTKDWNGCAQHMITASFDESTALEEWRPMIFNGDTAKRYSVDAILFALELLLLLHAQLEVVKGYFLSPEQSDLVCCGEISISGHTPSFFLDKIRPCDGSVQIQQEINLADLPSIASKWVAQAEHWHVNHKGGERVRLALCLHQWLLGKSPPQRCAALNGVGKQCLNCSAEPYSVYCKKVHGCSSAKGPCGNPRSSMTTMCESHRCLAIDAAHSTCKFERLSVGSYCADHACPGCLSLSPHSVSARVGMHACAKHSCKAKSCSMYKFSSQDYCERHCCTECAATGNPCLSPVEQVEGDSPGLCPAHKCAHPTLECNNVCAAELDSSFCRDHTCKECVHQGLDVKGLAVDEPPRNTCSEHGLCQTVLLSGDVCPSLAVACSPFCLKHSGKNAKKIKPVSDGQCCGVTKKKKRCLQKSPGLKLPGSAWYCHDHTDQAKKVDEDGKLSDDDSPETVVAPAAEDGAGALVRADRVKATALFRVVSCSEANLVCGGACNLKFLVPFAAPLKKRYTCSAHVVSVSPKPASKAPILSVNDAPTAVAADASLPPSPPPVELHASIGGEASVSKGKIKGRPYISEESVSGADFEDFIEDIQYSEALNGATDKDELDLRMDEMSLDMQPHAEPVHVVPAQPFHKTGVGLEDADYEADGTDDDDDPRQRLREIGAAEDLSDELVEEEAEVEESDSESEEEEDVEFTSPTEITGQWDWGWTRSQRLSSTAAFLRTMSRVVDRMRLATEKEVQHARMQRAQAGAAALKHAKVVGATVVGASRRLEVIRAAEPFAVVVEEACEVMEPTLMSVLAVNSLNKLELVGDHRQLPASVQNDWYNLQSYLPSIKTSLFERLISGTVVRRARGSSNRQGPNNETAQAISCSILDEQRRMRRSIADITRPDYNDVVDILDHPKTATQIIGDKLKSSDKRATEQLKLHMPLWHGRGRHIPGVAPCVYFWDIPNNKENGRDKRPIGGVSACNEIEAHAVLSLANYLMLCGVPMSSISIITPYKGQKMLLTKLLRDQSKNRSEETIFVSTVDRFQGDENDIIIFSPVRTTPGNQFVTLLNRFIVAVSRARLGFYLVGSVDAVTKGPRDSVGPAHWLRLQSLLAAALSLNDTEACGYDSSRVGKALPLCCPRHATTSRAITDCRTFPNHAKWGEFCREACTHVMPCKHTCAVRCHSPVLTPHTKDCMVLVPHPCRFHSTVPLRCMNLSRGPAETVEQALVKYECPEIVPHIRPECGHEVPVTCHFQKSGSRLNEECCVIVADFSHPECGHIFPKPQCFQRRQWEKVPPTCTAKVTHERPCGCRKSMACHVSLKEKREPVACNEAVDILRPRCSHKLSLRCWVAAKLNREWLQKSGNAVTPSATGKVTVVFKEHFGPTESSIISEIMACSNKVNYVAGCGHTWNDTLCCDAFDFSMSLTTPPRCSAGVRSQCCLCQQPTTLPCWLNNFTKLFTPWGRREEGAAKFDAVSKVLVIEESDVLQLIQYFTTNKVHPEALNAWKACCMNNIKVRRLACSTTAVTHSYKTSCKLLLAAIQASVDSSKGTVRNLEFGQCREHVNELFCFPCGVHKSRIELCFQLQSLQHQDNPICVSLVQAPLHRCGHLVTVKCADRAAAVIASPGKRLPAPTGVQDVQVVDASETYCNRAASVPACLSTVSFKALCGHVSLEVPCEDAFQWADDPKKVPLCEQEVSGVIHPVCQHPVTVPCYARHAVQNWNPWKQEVKYLDVTRGVDENGDILSMRQVNESDPRPVAADSELIRHLKCDQQVIYLPSCDHEMRLKCTDAYNHNAPKCMEPMERRCEQEHCQFVQVVPCHEYCKQKRAGKFQPCTNKVSKRCNLCEINDSLVPCSMNDVKCKREVTGELACGHTVKWICGTDLDPRRVNFVCGACELPLWKEIEQREVTVEEKNSFDFAARQLISKQVNSLCTVVDEHPLTVELDFHASGKKNLFRRLLDGMSNENLPAIVAPEGFASVEELMKYKIVFQRVGDNTDPESDAKISQAFTHCKPTVYGAGNMLPLFTQQNLEQLKPNSKDDTITICVGLAYCHNAVKDVNPFSSEKDINKRNTQQQTNKISNNFKKLGFDCVEVLPGGAALKWKASMVFWEPGAVIAISKVCIRMHSKCLICTEPVLHSGGCCCSKNHFLCWECLEDFAKNASLPDALNNYTDKNGDLKCSFPDCGEPYSLQSVGLAGDCAKGSFNALLRLKTGIVSGKEVAAAVDVERLKMTAEFERIQQIKDLDEREAHLLRRDIVETILTLRCPRCRAVFFDFDACCALTCNCGAGFCAWCLYDCKDEGNDAHRHVVHCKEWNPQCSERSMWANPEQWNKHHEKRKARLIDRKLDEVSVKSPLVAGICYTLLLDDVKGTNITLKMRAVAGRAGRRAPVVHSLPWTVQGVRTEAAGLTKYTLHSRDVTHTVSRETQEFNIACGHFSRLLNQPPATVKTVEVLEYDEDAEIKKEILRHEVPL